MSRRLVVTIALVFSLVAVTVGSAGADIIGGAVTTTSCPCRRWRSLRSRCTRWTPTGRAPTTTWCSGETGRPWRRSGR
jgi:hypothetical protein